MSPDAAKFERGEWLYRLPFPGRSSRTPRYRWYPASRFTQEQLDAAAPLREPPVVAAAASTPAAASGPQPYDSTFHYRFGTAI
jgi:hypothetical protein